MTAEKVDLIFLMIYLSGIFISISIPDPKKRSRKINYPPKKPLFVGTEWKVVLVTQSLVVPQASQTIALEWEGSPNDTSHSWLDIVHSCSLLGGRLMVGNRTNICLL